MSVGTALLIVVPLAAVHLALRRDRRALAFQLVLDLALLALPGRVLLAGRQLTPGVADGGSWGAAVAVAGSQEQSDFPLQFAVWWDEVRRLGAEGELPWISDRIGGGTPLYANGQSGVPFPLDVAVWLLGAVSGAAVMVVWKLELAALGAFLLVRRLGGRSAAGLLAGLAWGFAPVVLSWAVVPLSWVMAATPWALLLAVGALRGRRRAAALLALLLGALAGWSVHPESAVFLWLAVVLFAAVYGWGRARRLARLAPPLALAVLVAACGAVPTLLTVRHSAKYEALSRGVNYPDANITAATKLRVAALLLVPWREGRPQAGTWQLGFPAAPAVLSAGAVALVALLGGSFRRRHRRAALGLVAVGGAAAALFFQLPGLSQLAARVPVLQHMVWPRCGFLLTFAVVLLGALALDGWSRRRRARRLVAAALAVALVDLTLVLTAPRPARGPLLWLPVATPLAAAAGAVLISPVALALAGGLGAVASGWDILPQSTPSPAPSGGAAVGRLVADAGRLGGRTLGLNGALPANLSASLGLSDLRAADPVRSVELARLHRALGAGGTDLPGPVTRPWAGLAGCWGVRWLVTPPEGITGPWAAGWREVARDGRARVYENARALPALRLAARAVPPPGDPAAGLWEGVDFADTVVADGVGPLGGTGTLTAVVQRPAEVTAAVRAHGRVLAVLHVPVAAGWHATLDGREAPIVVADLAAMGVVVGDGSHTVEWRYRPPGLAAGAALTLLGLAGCAILAGQRRRR